MRAEVDQQISGLSSELSQAVAVDERMELQRRVMDLKSDANLQNMNIQLKYARLGNHEEHAETLKNFRIISKNSLIRARRGNSPLSSSFLI